MTEALRQRIREVLARVPGVYVGTDIPARKLANARTQCRVPVGELVFGLLDCTLFGSAKHAVLFADRVYICEGWAAALLGGTIVVEYDELAALEVTSAKVRFPRQRIDVPRRSFSRQTLQVLEAVKQVVGLVAPAAATSAPIAPSAQAIAVALAPEPEPDADDIGASPDAIELQAAIASTPDDEAPQLVLADLLLSADDPRGELIVLDNRERATSGGLTDPDALERFLLLAAEYSFPRARPEEPTLAFVGYGSSPVRFTVTQAGRVYDLQYRRSQLTVTAEGVQPLTCRLELQGRDTWTADETIVILRLVSDAIRAGSPLKFLRFPFTKEPLPIYDGGPLRGYHLPRDFTEPRGILPERYGLAARDYQRWMAIWLRLARMLKAEARRPS